MFQYLIFLRAGGAVNRRADSHKGVRRVEVAGLVVEAEVEALGADYLFVLYRDEEVVSEFERAHVVGWSREPIVEEPAPPEHEHGHD